MIRQPGRIDLPEKRTTLSHNVQDAAGADRRVRPGFMGVFDLFKQLFGGASNSSKPRKAPPPDHGMPVTELARRLDVPLTSVQQTPIRYHTFTVPKRSGKTRRFDAPDPSLKELQRRILHRLLKRLRTHPAAVGFESGLSIVTNARSHIDQAVVIRMDLKDFFNSTTSERVYRYFRAIGWNHEAGLLLRGLCTHEGSLPQGAPTSPRLSNLVNVRLDARLSGLGLRFGAMYTRYADDLTFSLSVDDAEAVHSLIGMTKAIVAEYGYRLHMRRKLHIRRRHDQQIVTGLVVNQSVNLPRRTRRWLRAVEHRRRTGGQPTLSDDQLAGWTALRHMINAQRAR
jgi:retron-type reverse transcriptase